MIKGLLAGLLSGGVVSVAVLGAVSLMSAPPVPHEVATASAVPGMSPTGAEPAAETETAAESATPATGETAATGTVPESPAVSEPQPSAPTEPAQTAEAARAAPDAAVIAPPAGSEFDKPAVDAPAPAPASDAAVSIAPAPAATAPEAREPTPPSIGGDTAPQPDQSDASVLAKAPDAEAAPAAPTGLDLPTEPKSVPVPEASTAPDAAPVPPLATLAPEPAPQAAPEPAPGAIPAPALTPDQPQLEATQPDEGAALEPAPDEPTDESLPGDPLPEEMMPDEGASGGFGAGSTAVGKRVLPPVLKGGEKPSDAAPSNLPPVISPDAPEPPKGVTAAPKPGFQRPVPGVRVNRLPTIQSAPAGEGPEAFDSVEPAPPSAPDAPGMIEAPVSPRAADVAELPLHRYAARLDNPANLPVLGVIVIELGNAGGGANMADLMALPVPVTLAINPMRKDGLEVAARARAHGFEVAMLADGLPKEGTASDVEVSYQSISAGMPEAVAVMTSPENTLMTRRPVAQQMVAILKDEGLGLVSYARGLSPAREIARSQGLPQAEVSRVVDEPRGDAAEVLRTLEAEAFQAQQKGGAVVVLRSYPDSIAALKQFIAKAEAEKSGLGVKVGPVTAFLK